MLRFADRSPLPDSSHKEEAGRRSSVAKEAEDGLLSAAHPVPRTGVGARADPALAFGALIAFAGSRLRGFTHLESSARLSREAVALVRWTFLPTVHSHCKGRVKWSWEIGCLMLGERWGVRAAKRLRSATHARMPLGNREFVAGLERRFDRRLTLRGPGPQPKTQAASS